MKTSSTPTQVLSTMLLIALGLLIGTMSATISIAGNKYSIATGNFGTVGVWSNSSGGGSCGCTPSSSDDVTIENNYSITLNNDFTIKKLTVKTGGDFVVTANYTLTATSDVLVDGAGATITLTSGTISTTTGSVTAQNTGALITINGGTWSHTANGQTFKIKSGADMVLSSGSVFNDKSDMSFEDAGTTFTMSGGMIDMDNGGSNKTFKIKNEAVLTFTNGSIENDGDFRIENGGLVYMNTGTPSINQTDATKKFKIKDKGTSNSSLFDMDAGTITVAGDMEIDGGGSGANPTLDISGGTVSISGNTTFKGDVGDEGRLYVSGGTITLSGDVTNEANGSDDVNMHLILSGAGTMIFGGNLEMDDVTNTGNTGGDVFTQSGGTARFTGTSKIWTNSGTFSASAGTVSFEGSTTLAATGSFTFYNLTMNSSASSPQLTLNTVDVPVNNQISMSAGNINLSSHTLTLGTSSASKGTLSYSAGLMYGGTFTRWYNTIAIADGNSAGLFPLGTSSLDNRIFYVTPSTGPTTGGTVSMTHTASATATIVSFADGAATVEVRNDLYWTTATGNGLAGGTYTLRMEGANFGTIGDVNDLRITLNGSVVGTAGSNGGTVSNPIVRRTGLTLGEVSNSFYMGSVNYTNSPLNMAPLPIELSYFNAKFDGSNVELAWTTQSETNNSFFAVERTQNGEDFEVVATEKGAGNSSTVLNYHAYDMNPLRGVAYYRLKQTDVNGKSTYSDLVAVKISVESDFAIYPNPSNGNFYVNIQATAAKEILVVVRDLTGREAFSKIIPEFIDGTYLIATDASSKLMPGIYMVTASSANQIFSQKLIIK